MHASEQAFQHLHLAISPSHSSSRVGGILRQVVVLVRDEVERVDGDMCLVSLQIIF